MVYRKKGKLMEVFLVHPGGPFWKNKDDGAWSIPKGEFETDEEPLNAAQREFLEETGIEIKGKFISLGTAKLKSGKLVHSWAIESDIDETSIQSNTFEIEWPPHSQKKQSFPEIDRAAWFRLEEAAQKINPGQLPFLNVLEKLVDP